MKAAHLILAAILPAATLALPAVAQQRVLVDPIRANLDRDWLYEIKESRGKAHAVTERQARDIAADMAASLERELHSALRAQGFEVVPAAGPGVVRLAVSLDDLYVNAVESGAAGSRNLTREAGRATLRAEARNPAGAVVLASEERANAGDTGKLRYTTDVSNRFWFDSTFRNWSATLARDLRTKAL